ncbi:hypothetical protein LINGRAPRIM_LOCUS1737 [Linum grandiflorum]
MDCRDGDRAPDNVFFRAVERRRFNWGIEAVEAGDDDDDDDGGGGRDGDGGAVAVVRQSAVVVVYDEWYLSHEK